MLQPSDSKLHAVAAGSIVTSYEENDSGLCWVLQGGVMQNEECMFGNGLKVGWLKPFQYISACSFIAHEKSRIFTPVFKTSPIQAL
jgi:hypothetical protein